MDFAFDNILYVGLLLDVATILIIFIYTIVNFKRGFAKIFISVIGYVLAIVLGSMISDSSAEPIYDNVLKPQITSNVQDVLKDYDISTSLRDRIKKDTYGINISDEKLKNIISSPDAVYNAINGTEGTELISRDKIVTLIGETIEDEISKPLKSLIPSSAVDYMMNSIKSNSDMLYKTASELVQDDTNPAEYIEETFIRPILIYIIKMAVFFIVFAIVMIIVKMISKSLENKDDLSVASATDKVLGGILGIAQAVILLLVICIVLKFLVSINSSVSQMLNDDTIQNTKVFKYIYNIDTLKMLI